jgi:hypothetical protein
MVLPRIVNVDSLFSDLKKEIISKTPETFKLKINDIEYQTLRFLYSNGVKDKVLAKVLTEKLIEFFDIKSESESQGTTEKSIVHIPKIYTCEYCNRRFGNFGNYNSHVLAHGKNDL